MRQGTGATGPANRTHYLISLREMEDYCDEGWFILPKEEFLKVRDAGHACVCAYIITPGKVLVSYTHSLIFTAVILNIALETNPLALGSVWEETNSKGKRCKTVIVKMFSDKEQFERYHKIS